VFLPEAWVFHDPGASSGLLRWARKRYRYLLAMAMSLLKNEQLGRRLGERRRKVRHPLRLLEDAMKPFALVHARLRWSRVKGARFVIPAPEPEPAP
jgi:hypothetical protein